VAHNCVSLHHNQCSDVNHKEIVTPPLQDDNPGAEMRGRFRCHLQDLRFKRDARSLPPAHGEERGLMTEYLKSKKSDTSSAKAEPL
jgi:hypothetical protein